MDRNFVKFWASFLNNYIKTQENMENVSDWIAKGFEGFDELNRLFQKSYGLDRLSESTASYLTMWEQSKKNFERSLAEYLSLMGVVPKQEHLDLLEKYEALKEKAASQEETILHLRRLLEGSHLDQKEFRTGFETLIEKQTDDFNRLITAMGAIGVKEEPVEEPAPSRKKAKKSGGTRRAAVKK